MWFVVKLVTYAYQECNIWLVVELVTIGEGSETTSNTANLLNKDISL